MRRDGATRVLIVASIVVAIAGCATASPDTDRPSLTPEIPNPSPSLTTAVYDAQRAQSVMLTAADTSDLARAGFTINQSSPSVSKGVVEDVYGEWTSTATTSPEVCGPVYWLAVTGIAERDSTDPFVSGPYLDAVSADGGSSTSANASQGARIFATPDAAQRHFSNITSSLGSCAEYRVDGQAGAFTYEEALAEPLSADTIHLRQTQTSFNNGFNPVDTTRVDEDRWVFLRGNLIVIVEGHRDGGGISTLAGIIKARLGSVTSPDSAPMSSAPPGVALDEADLSSWEIGFNHVGPIRVGMTHAELSIDLGSDTIERVVSSWGSHWEGYDLNPCSTIELTEAGPASHLVLLAASEGWLGAIDKIDVVDDMTDGEWLPRTVGGVGIGSTEEDIRAEFGNTPTSQRHPHVIDWTDFIVTGQDQESAMVFTVDESGRVISISVGRLPDVRFHDGCS